ncbi:MAG: PD-(D/E)XK nuclease family protein [Candidatus Bathyarchaeota archaeon]|jgi:hypothetical protein
MNFDNLNLLPMACRQSTISCALHCPRKWFCQYRLGITLRGGERKDSANLGTVYHKFQQLGPGKENEVKKWVMDWQKELMAQVDKGEDLDGNILHTATLLTDLYNKALVMAKIFWKRFPQPSYFKVLGSEIHHKTYVAGLMLEGTIDKLLLNTQDNRIWIRDHKSTGDTIEKVFAGISWSLQGRIYRIITMDYLRKVLGMEAVASGFILDGIMFPGIKLCKTDIKNAKSWNVSEEEAYLRRVEEWYDDQMEAAIRSRSMMFNEPLYPDELRTDLGMMKHLESLGNHPKAYRRDESRNSCFVYKKTCIYHDLCETSPEQWDGLFGTKYRIEKPAEETENEEKN